MRRYLTHMPLFVHRRACQPGGVHIRAAASVLCVRIGSGTEEHEEHLEHFDPPGLVRRCVQRRHSYQLVPRIHIGTGGKQDLYDLGAFEAIFEVVSVATHVPILDSLVQSSVPILTAPGNPLTERVHVRTGGKQSFDDFDRAIPDRELKCRVSIHPGVRICAGGNQGFHGAEVPTTGGIHQLAVEEAGVVSRTGRSHEDEHEDNGDEKPSTATDAP